VTESGPAPGLLSGYRVLDLSTEMGALCGRLLRDLGAEVIKIEPPEGDGLRREPPFGAGSPDLEASLRFAYLNAGKKGVTLDLGQPAGRELFLRLVGRADVVVESGPPGGMAALGLEYAALKAARPGVILALLSGFGQSGPYAQFQAPDIVTMAMGGLLYVSGDPSHTPCMPPETQSYYYGSLYAAYGILLALWRREQTGEGSCVDVSVQAAMAIHEHVAFTYSVEKRLLKRAGSQHQHVAPANLFPCSNGYISIFAAQQQWRAFLDVWEGHPAELDDPRWENMNERRKQAAWINPLVDAFTSRYTKEALAEILQERGIPAMPVNTTTDFMNDAHIRYRDFFGEVTHPRLGVFAQAGAPFMVNQRRPSSTAAPLLGQDNRDLYCGELGLDAAELEVLVAGRVV
jgi:crotonobetainyl-CoA:carnitine CoA-transferase CaiB-like acyl-CoA transferase